MQRSWLHGFLSNIPELPVIPHRRFLERRPLERGGQTAEAVKRLLRESRRVPEHPRHRAECSWALSMLRDRFRLTKSSMGGCFSISCKRYTILQIMNLHTRSSRICISITSCHAEDDATCNERGQANIFVRAKHEMYYIISQKYNHTLPYAHHIRIKGKKMKA